MTCSTTAQHILQPILLLWAYIGFLLAIFFYLGSSDGLCCQLTSPCRHIEPNTMSMARDVWEINRSEITLLKKLGAGMFGDVWKGHVILWSMLFGLFQHRALIIFKTMKQKFQNKQ